MKYDLKKLRCRLGIEVKDIADAFGCSVQNIYYLERKKAYPKHILDWMLAQKNEEVAFDDEIQELKQRIKKLEQQVKEQNNGNV